MWAPLHGPGIGVASTPQTSVLVYWEQGQVLIMAPPSLSSLVFDTEEDRLRVMDLRNKLKGTKAAVSNYIGQTAQDTPKFIPSIREFIAQCTAAGNAFFKRQALLECKTAENMLDGLRNRILHQTTELLSCLEGITNQENARGKVQECIDNTQQAQDSYLERLKAAVNRLATVQLEAASLLSQWMRLKVAPLQQQQQQEQKVEPHKQQQHSPGMRGALGMFRGRAPPESWRRTSPLLSLKIG